MKKRIVGKEKNKIEYAITIGMIGLVIFLVTGSLEHFLFRKSAKEIGFLIGNLYKNAIKFC